MGENRGVEGEPGYPIAFFSVAAMSSGVAS
jgi:hypothetical protein